MTSKSVVDGRQVVQRYRHRTRSSASTWEDGLIAGSGVVGAIVHGEGGRQIVSLAHERNFLPAHPRLPAPELAPVLPALRAAVLAGDGARADELMDEAAHLSGLPDGLVWTDPLGICATLWIEDPAAAGEQEREIDLELGEVAVRWRDRSGAATTLRVLAPRGESRVWLAFESEAGATLSVRLSLAGASGPGEDTGAPDYADLIRPHASGGAQGLLAASVHGSEATRVTASGPEDWVADPAGEVTSTRVYVPPGERRIVRVDVDVAAAAPHAADDEEPTWEALRARQRAEHGALVGASLLDLRGATAALTTDELWQQARTGDAAARRAVVETAYLSGRANAIAATGELPPTLQGVWQGTWAPAWSADYTMNGNVQNGGIASLIPTGTPELARSLLNLVLPHLDDYRENARRVHGTEGMLLPARMSSHGLANHTWRWHPHVFWMGCGGWVLRFAADLVATTGDRAIVDDDLWALVEGVLVLAEQATVQIDGRRHIVPDYSPENSPVPGGSSLAADATVDVAILRDAARAAAVLGEARGDHSLDDRWQAIADALPEYRIAADGTLAEWVDGRWPENHAHRHASQLYPLWYEADPAFTDGTARAASLRDAAAATIAAKIAWRAEDPTAPPGRMEMAFGLVQLGLAAAALGRAEDALRCVEWLAIDHWRPALTTTHDAGRIFNLDASGGLPAVVAAMLLGSGIDTLTVLPALPDAWPEGSVTGLRARGGVVVDRLDWDPTGCTLRVRRVPGAEWLRPDGRVLVRAGRAFAASGGAARERHVFIGTEPSVLRLDWTDEADARPDTSDPA
jgi:hypothetical protein